MQPVARIGIKSIQRGIASSASQSYQVAIAPVDPAKTEVRILGTVKLKDGDSFMPRSTHISVNGAGTHIEVVGGSYSDGSYKPLPISWELTEWY